MPLMLALCWWQQVRYYGRLRSTGSDRSIGDITAIENGDGGATDLINRGNNVDSGGVRLHYGGKGRYIRERKIITL